MAGGGLDEGALSPAELAGVAAGGAAAVIRAPLGVVVLVGALATAGVRLLS